MAFGAIELCSGGKITRGYQGMLDRYRKNYPTRQAMGTLTFTGLEVRELTPRAALVLGRWEIKGSEPNGGRFTLVFEAPRLGHHPRPHLERQGVTSMRRATRSGVGSDVGPEGSCRSYQFLSEFAVC